MAGNGNAGDYILGRGTLASSRLNLQHYLWKSELGYLIHPSVNAKDLTRVADVGCGTGIWAVEVAKEIPRLQIYAADIDLAQAPPQEWLPKNVELGTFDIFEDIPEHLHGKFDLVHVRLLILVIQNDDPTPVVQNLLKMLKPGGYIQWGEYDREWNVRTAEGVSAEKFVNALRFPSSIQKRQQDQRLNATWMDTFGQRLQELGLSVLADESKVTQPENYALQQDVNMLALAEVGHNWPEEELSKYRTALREADDERWSARRGMAIANSRHVWVAQKPAS